MTKTRRVLRKPVIAFIVGVIALSSFNAQPVRALFFIPEVTFSTTVQDIPRSVSEAVTKATDAVKARVKDSIAIAFKQAARQFLGNAVQQMALSLATTQPGQLPLFLQSPRTYLRDVADAAAGDFIDGFTKGVTGSSQCTSPDPVVRQRCLEQTGTTGGSDPTSGQRGRFIISRLLRAGSDATYQACLQGAQEKHGIGDAKKLTLTSVPTNSITSLEDMDRWGKYTNDYQRGVALLLSFKKYYLDVAIASGDREINCMHVAPRPDVSTDLQWDIAPEACVDSPCMVTPTECLAHVQDAINYNIAASQKEEQDARTQCKTGLGGDVRNYVTQATATDVFAAADNFDIRTSPKLISARFQNNSDISQYFQAAALLTSSVQSKLTGEDTYLNSGLLPRTSRVGDKTLAPKEAASALFGIPFYNNNGELTYTGTGAADIIRGLASFVNSPVGKALFTYFRSQCGLNPNACKGPTNTQSEIGRMLFGTGGATGIAAAQVQYASIGQTDTITGSPGKNDIDILGQLTSSGIIDQALRTAVDEGLTVQEALDRNLLSKKKIVGFDRNGIEPTNGYPYRTLQYLRKYRIISVGWELAAKYAYQFASNELTLDTLTKQYSLCAQDTAHKVCSDSLVACTDSSQCNQDDGETCGASPYCGLVDPNWVLKAPQTFCRRQGAGEEIVTKEFVCDVNNVDKTTGDVIPTGTVCDDGTNANAVCHDTAAPNCVENEDNNQFPDIGRWVISRNTDTCADSQSCLAEDEDGTCLAYGYCVQERQTFKFGGTSCEAQNISCTSYTDSSGAAVSYLAKNLDTNCNADDVGCQWYCAKPSYNDTNKQWQCTATTGTKVHLTAKADDCKAGDAGCRQFIRLTPGTNFLQNGGFEYYNGNRIDVDPATFNGWTAPVARLTPITSTDSDNTVGNTVAARAQFTLASDTIRQTVNIGASPNGRVFTFSLRAQAATSCSAEITLCTGSDCQTSAVHPSATFTATPSWETYAVTMAVPSADITPISSTLLTAVIRPDGCHDAGFAVDSAQVKESSETSTFSEYGTTNVVHLNGQRRTCEAADIGCERYTPVAGGAVVNGILASENLCTRDQVGCQQYERQPITSVPYRDARPNQPATGVDVTIVAAQGKLCSAAEVGCEEYTNLDAVKAGGEGKEYYQTARQCVPTTSTVAKKTYYTWIGDPEKGFVLQSQQLVVSNLNGGPCAQMGLGRSDGTLPTCRDTAATINAAACLQGDLASDPDCAEFYDSDLNVYYMHRSATVPVSADCHPYRNTIDSTEPTCQAGLCSSGGFAGQACSADNDCRNGVYYMAKKQNTSCSAAAAGCREFIGNSGRASRQIFQDTMEKSSLSNWVGGSWSASSPNASGHSIRIDPPNSSTKGVAFTVTSALKGKVATGKSYLLTVTAAAATPGDDIRLRAFFGRGNDVSGSFDELGGVAFQQNAGAQLVWNESITPAGPEWHSYTLGPISLSNAVDPDWRLGLVVEGGSGYVDNVKLTEINDRTYVVNNSAPLCPASAIGCQAYRDRAGSLNYATSFARLCNDKVVGCEAMIDTQNSTTPFEQTVKGVTTPADRIVTVVNDSANYCNASAKACEMVGEPVYGRDDTIASFKTVYKIIDPDQFSTDLCSAEAVSCEAYTTQEGTTVYFKDPRGRTCEYRSGGSITGGWFITGTSYRCPTVTPPTVSQPIGASCTPVCAGGTRDGKACKTVGSSAECPGSPAGVCTGNAATTGKIVVDGNPVVGSCTTDTQCGTNKCRYLVGVCPSTENGCTEYRDPTEPVNCRAECPLELMGGTPLYVDASCTKTVCASSDPANKRIGQNCQTSDQCTYAGIPGTCVGADNNVTTGAPGCRAYTLIRQSVEDTASDCNGQINTATGCRPFYDTSNSSLNFRGQ